MKKSLMWYFWLPIEGVGKNNMGINKQGQHYPNRRFEVWRKEAFYHLKQFYLPSNPIDTDNYFYEFKYYPKDRRKQDITGILDGVFHLFERAKIVKDDSLIKNITFTTCYNRHTLSGELQLEYEKRSLLIVEISKLA